VAAKFFILQGEASSFLPCLGGAQSIAYWNVAPRAGKDGTTALDVTSDGREQTLSHFPRCLQLDFPVYVTDRNAIRLHYAQEGRAPMTRRLATILFVTMFLIGVSSPAIRAQGNDRQADTLKGISTITVLVEDLPDSAEVIGLAAEAIQTDVELKLRLAGMRVLTNEEAHKLSGTPLLYVRAGLLTRAEAAIIEVQLLQNAVLERNGQVALGVITWDRADVVANPTAQSIRDRVKDRVDEFLNDWLSVNPMN
jgi:hypothetical protein